MRLIILAAGHGYALDGMTKCLIKNPETNRTLLEDSIKVFANTKVTIVVGYRAVEILQQFPQYNYVYNAEWAVTNNSYSLGLALTDDPCFVISSDLLFPTNIINEIQSSNENVVFTSNRENRSLTAINCVLDTYNRICGTYVGPLRTNKDPEAVGIFKISNIQLLKKWKKNCLKHGNLFIGQNLPCNDNTENIFAHDISSFSLNEINTPQDYIQLLKKVVQ